MYSSAHPSRQQWGHHTRVPEGTDLSPGEFCSSLNKRTCTLGTSFSFQTLRLFGHLSFMCMGSTGKIAAGKGETTLTAYHKLTAAGHQVTSICSLEYHTCISGNKLVLLLVVQLLYYIFLLHTLISLQNILSSNQSYFQFWFHTEPVSL